MRISNGSENDRETDYIYIYTHTHIYYIEYTCIYVYRAHAARARLVLRVEFYKSTKKEKLTTVSMSFFSFSSRWKRWRPRERYYAVMIYTLQTQTISAEKEASTYIVSNNKIFFGYSSRIFLHLADPRIYLFSLVRSLIIIIIIIVVIIIIIIIIIMDKMPPANFPCRLPLLWFLAAPSRLSRLQPQTSPGSVNNRLDPASVKFLRRIQPPLFFLPLALLWSRKRGGSQGATRCVAGGRSSRKVTQSGLDFLTSTRRFTQTAPKRAVVECGTVNEWRSKGTRTVPGPAAPAAAASPTWTSRELKTENTQAAALKVLSLVSSSRSRSRIDE